MSSSRTPSPRAASLVSFLPLLVLLMVASTAMAGLGCKKDSECRRNICIFELCKPRPTTGSVCEFNSNCLKAPTEVCINSKCSAKSSTGGSCDETGDCAAEEDECKEGKCTSPKCDTNAQCPSPQVCISTKCTAKSPTGGPCDEAEDCATEGDKCSDENTCVAGFNPSTLEWQGNKGINEPRTQGAGVAVGNDLFVFAGRDIASGEITKSVVKYDSVANTWESKLEVSVATVDHSVVVINEFIFLIGGFDGSGALKTFFRYDTINDKWDETWKQLPFGVTRAAAAVYKDTIFLFGGEDGSDNRLNTILSIDTSNKNNDWVQSQTAFLPVATSVFTAVTANADIYLIGGGTDNGISNKVYKFNPEEPGKSPVDTGKTLVQARDTQLSFYHAATQRLYAIGGVENTPNDAVEFFDLISPSGAWTSAKAPSYVNIASNVGGLIGSKFYLTAGPTSPVALQSLDVSNPQNVIWSPFPNSPVLKASIASISAPNEIVVVPTFGSSRKIAFYSTETNTWTTGNQDFPAIRLFSAFASPNGVLHVIGGLQASSVKTDVYIYDRAKGWTTLTSPNILPEARARACAAASDTQIFLYGGVVSTSSLSDNSMFVSDLDANGHSTTWTKIDNSLSSVQPTGVTHCAAVVANGKVLIIGGSSDSPTGLIQIFDITTKKWETPHASKITPRSFLSAVLLDDFVFIIGGTSVGISIGSLNKVEVLDTKAPFTSSTAVKAIKDMPTPRFNLASLTDGVSIFSVGGTTAGEGSFPSLEKLRVPGVLQPY